MLLSTVASVYLSRRYSDSFARSRSLLFTYVLYLSFRSFVLKVLQLFVRFERKLSR